MPPTTTRPEASGVRGQATWFKPLPQGEPSTLSGDASEGGAGEVESQLDTSWSALPGREFDSRYLSRQMMRLAVPGQHTRERIFRAFLRARIVLGVAIVLTHVAIGVMGTWPDGVLVGLSVAYLTLAVATGLRFDARVARVERPGGLRRRDWLATVGVDLLCFSGLHLLAPAAGLNYAALLVQPVLMAGVLVPGRRALGIAAAATLVLLASAWLLGARGADLSAVMLQAGLLGSGLFVVSLIAGELATRLDREERTARGSLERARQETQLNRLVIDEMQDGVLVVDRAGWVRRANPAAAALLVPVGQGREPPFQLRGVAAWESLVDAVDDAHGGDDWPENGRDVPLVFEPGFTRTLRVRVRFTRRLEGREGEDVCVLFLEDVRAVQARTRTEKLAAMGRVSAGIAHEIRNPLAAITQASALLLEEATQPAQRRLLGMVADNAERLKRIVDDVLEAAPADRTEAGPIDATAVVEAACSEWLRTARLSAAEAVAVSVDLPAAPLGVRFDPDHLRRVLVNLLDNALRHSTRRAGAVQVRLFPKGERDVALAVRNDGELIAPDVERYLFEPFFSTRSRGTGLGLYICRELCGRYGARIDYRARPEPAGTFNEFQVLMRRAELPVQEARLQLGS
jgi:two-component system sensor histidine kinase PilS (NtrC family)